MMAIFKNKRAVFLAILIAIAAVLLVLVINALREERQEANRSQTVQVSIDSPKEGATVEGLLTIKSSIKNAQSINKVEFYIDGTLRFVSYEQPFTATIDTATLTNGRHTLEVVVFDKNGRYASEITITIQNEAIPEPVPTPVENPTPQTTSGANKKQPAKQPAPPSASDTNTAGDPGPQPDTQAPSAPTGLNVSANSPTEAQLSWLASTDNVGVTAYIIYRDGIEDATVDGNTLTYADAGLTPGGSYTYTVRARDAAGNTSPDSLSIGIIMPANTVVSIWDDENPAEAVDSGDATSVVVATRFMPLVDGQITGVRFYKVAANTGTHIGSIWTADGTTSLAEVEYADETATGWQTAMLGTPLEVTANTPYVVSYFAPNGHYAATGNYFTTDTGNEYIVALADAPGASNGLYEYSFNNTFPDSTFNKANYWVDVLFEPAP